MSDYKYGRPIMYSEEQQRGEEGETRKRLVRYRYILDSHPLTTIVIAYFPYGGNLCTLAGLHTDPDMPFSPFHMFFGTLIICTITTSVSTAWPADDF